MIPAKLIEKQSIVKDDYTRKIEELQVELKKLKENYMILKGIVDSLKTEILKLKTGLIKTPLIKEEKTLEAQPKIEAPTSQLPSFFKDNPWLEVLAKRGKEPETYGS
ncbi:MAG: hypothetical protein QXE30_04760 [Candidatus Bathyarchaeia archaeon]